MLKKVSQTTPTSAQIVDGYNTSTTDGYSSNYINNLHTYSTDEVRVGTWLGKPLYRKVLSYTGTISNNTSTPHNINNLDKVTNYYGYYITAGNLQVPLPVVFNATNYIVGVNYFDSTNINWSAGSSVSISDRPIILVLEYTKTTD